MDSGFRRNDDSLWNGVSVILRFTASYLVDLLRTFN